MADKGIVYYEERLHVLTKLELFHETVFQTACVPVKSAFELLIVVRTFVC